MTPAEQLALWADRLRDMAASGLKYSQNIYDHAFKTPIASGGAS